MSLIKYRPELDGLRALAVLSVILYHAELSLFGHMVLPGGFLGVDVFFVISGYLISSILFREISASSFSIVSFYERRARRILPALYCMMLATLSAAYFIFLPKGMMEYAKSGLAALGFSSNIWFWLENSYIAEASKLKPLLHTWSLAVEEQFYIVFPLLAYLLIRHASGRIWQWLLGLFVFSLVLAHFGAYYFAKFDFYYLPTRAWELMGGAMIALAGFQGKWSEVKQRFPALAEAGIVVLLICMFVLDDHMPHPSLLTFVPVAATMAIIAFGHADGPCYRFLSLRPVVFIGLISYSLYLWHFPVFAFARNLGFFDPPILKFLYFLLSCLLSYLAYRFVEQPLRDRRRVGLWKLVVVISVMLLVLIAANIGIIRSKGFPKSLGPLESVFKDLTWHRLDCPPDHPCQDKIGASQAVINLGDSHSWNFDYPLRDMAQNNGRSFISITHGGCPYILDTYVIRDGKPFACSAEFVSEAYKQIDRLSPSIIVYKARLPVYLDKGRFFDNGEGGQEGEIRHNLLNELYTTDDSNEFNALSDHIRTTFWHMLDKGNTVVLVYPIPAVGWNVVKTLRSKLENIRDLKVREAAINKDPLTTSYARYNERIAATRQVLDGLGSHPNLIRIYPDQLLCSEQSGRCNTQDQHGIYYIDDDHPSRYLATKMVTGIEKKLVQSGVFSDKR